MAKIEDIFIDLQKNKKKWLQSKKGSEFEDKFESACKKKGFTREIKEDYKEELKKIKEFVLDDLRENKIENIFNSRPEMIDMFITQPFGSQNYPDFLVFTKQYIIPIEIKYSSENATKPMWNGNLPKANGIYIFGSYKKGDVTFFRGIDILNNNDRKKLLNFWKQEREHYQNFKKELQKDVNFENEYGFDVYIRETYTQNKQINKEAIIDFFANVKKNELENKVIEFLKGEENE